MKNNQLLNAFGQIDERFVEEAAPEAGKKRKRNPFIKWGVAAACIILLIGSCFGTFAAVAEANEYKEAVGFFEECGISIEGLTKSEVKAVYRDITSKSFLYSKTAEVIQNGILSQKIGGYEILQDALTPEEVEKLWNIYWDSKNHSKTEGISYAYHNEYTKDDSGITVHDKGFFEKYDGEKLLWSVSVSEFKIWGYRNVSDGIIAYGQTETDDRRAWMVKIDGQGNILWKKQLENMVQNEYIIDILENYDKTFAVISRGDFRYFCLGQYKPNGDKILYKKTDIGQSGVRNVAKFGDGYLVQISSYGEIPKDKIAKVDHEGNITGYFSFGSDESHYFINDMMSFGGKIYLSGCYIEHVTDAITDAIKFGTKYEHAALMDLIVNDHLFSSEELTPAARDRFTAILLVCEPDSGNPREFYSVKRSFGSDLSVSQSGELLWNVESIIKVEYSPFTNAFSFTFCCLDYKYGFDASGTLVGCEKTDEIVTLLR